MDCGLAFEAPIPIDPAWKSFDREIEIRRTGALGLDLAELEPDTLSDFDQRIRAVAAFRDLPEAESLAAAKKREALEALSAGRGD